LDEDEFARAINGDAEIELALGSLNFGNVDVKISDGVSPLS
jgi:hypothetical protein